MLVNLIALNKRLADHFGLYLDGQPNWRVVWSENQLEKRFGTYEDRTPEGLFIRRVTEVREVPKYKQYIHNRYILERLLPVPSNDPEGAPVTKLTYEPLWVFEGSAGQPIPPTFEACKFIVDKVVDAMAKPGVHAQYKETNDDVRREDKAEFDHIHEALFGSESSIADALHYGKGVFIDATKRLFLAGK